ncbi:CU044_5270 family protein [Dactylosporangium sp. AC04546]|uniref:CU044_5270 family protein n=1 Tax=Dactylosporangium sp. AC04546 TaxID=2862460 RepID=UPI002E7B98AD|nr:CU044_5270 family protein [Dactylosporangium sp. AC04546]WVK81158.1 CU044_5270 family protein [Dactylosporangium sp. AC04546]
MTTSNDRDELARLVPAPAERDLPGDRHHRLQEFVMSEIHRDPHPAAPSPRRPLLRRSVLVTSALTAALAAVIAVAATATSGGDPVPPAPSTPSAPPAPAVLSGQDILLAAATTALQQPAGTGTYWHLKARSLHLDTESWTDRDGRTWERSTKTGGQVVARPGRTRYALGAPDVSFQQLQDLPTTPDALKAWIAAATDAAHEYISGLPIPEQRDRHVYVALISLVSQLPAPPAVRAAAFQAIAAYPTVTNLGPVPGGIGLLIPAVSSPRSPERLVIDPATTQIREADFFITTEGAVYSAADGHTVTLQAEWTTTRPE